MGIMAIRDDINRAVLIASTLVTSWLGMQAVHELGHVLGAWATGAEVTQVVLHPLAFSRIDLAENRLPGVVVWAGPIVGAALPLAVWLVAVLLKLPGAFFLRFIAGFCLVANGLYIGLGSFGRVGDCGEMLRHGSPAWQIWLFGMTAVPLGLWLWHGQGKQFGLGKNAEPASNSIALASLLARLALVVGELVWSR
jgi:hypothetical protein